MNFNKERIRYFSKKLTLRLYFRILSIFIFLGLMFFLTAGSIQYWEGWIFLFILLIPVLFFVTYFTRKKPDLIERRILKNRENEKDQKTIKNLFAIIFLVAILLPGIDYRFSWSSIPFSIVLCSDVLVLFGYIIIVWVIKVNSFASAIVEISKDHEVIDTGPYKIVRHPMYAGQLVFFLFTPLALGSYWAVIPFLIGLPVVFALRITSEEKYLIINLPGYKDYRRKTKYRLIPYIW